MNSYPNKGLGMMFLTILFSLGLLVYIGADFSEYRISERKNEGQYNNIWWERGFITACPLH